MGKKKQDSFLIAVDPARMLHLPFLRHLKVQTKDRTVYI